MELPPDETGPVPVRRAAVEPHLFGVTPPVALFALAAAAVAVGILLLALGALLPGVVVLVFGLVLVVAFLRVARRKPDSRLASASTAAVDEARGRVAVALGTYATRSRARRRIAGLRAELLRLEQRRSELLLALGRAVYRADDAATESVRAELAELDRTATDKEAKMETIAESARAEVTRARLEAQPTEMVEVPGGPATPEPAAPEPARIPEPYPPPGEGDLPEPAHVPEPYPPPDEGDLPEPARIPEPGGDDR